MNTPLHYSNAHNQGKPVYWGNLGKDLKQVDLVIFSHTRWNTVFHRPQQITMRMRSKFRVFYMEEPVYQTKGKAFMNVNTQTDGITVVTPHLPATLQPQEEFATYQNLLHNLFEGLQITKYIAWYYSATSFNLSKHLTPELAVYDCMEELQQFKANAPELKAIEEEMIQKADIIFTDSFQLFNEKVADHYNIHPFPNTLSQSSFDDIHVEDLEDEHRLNLNMVDAAIANNIWEFTCLEMYTLMQQAWYYKWASSCN